MAFYHNGIIDRRIPNILGYINNVVLSKYRLGDPAPCMVMVGTDSEELNYRFFNLIGSMRSNSDFRLQHSIRIIFLSSEQDKRTQFLGREIPNDKLSKSNKVIRFVQSQKYVSLSRLRTAQSTSELEPPKES
jgi:hypothetical protein